MPMSIVQRKAKIISRLIQWLILEWPMVLHPFLELDSTSRIQHHAQNIKFHHPIYQPQTSKVYTAKSSPCSHMKSLEASRDLVAQIPLLQVHQESLTFEIRTTMHNLPRKGFRVICRWVLGVQQTEPQSNMICDAASEDSHTPSNAETHMLIRKGEGLGSCAVWVV